MMYPRMTLANPYHHLLLFIRYLRRQLRADAPWSRQLLLCALCSVVVACDNDISTETPAVAPLRPVKVIEASAGAAALQRILAATVISADSQNLSFRVAGAITTLSVNVGDRLQAGEIVASLDQQPYLLSQQEARASLAQAEATYVNAQSQYQRTRELYATEAASLADMENAKANASSARASRARSREVLKAAELNVSYSQLRSPSDNCQIVSVPVALNQNVNAGQSIATTACGDQLRLRTVVPESLINTIELGMSVTATLRSSSGTISGKIIEIGVSNTNSTGYAVEIELDSPPADARVGMAAEVTLDIDAGDQRLLLPLIAVLSDNNEKFVYVANQEDEHYRIVRQVVETGALDNDGIEIVRGLKPGQQVVVAGMSRISEGMQVTLYAGSKL